MGGLRGYSPPVLDSVYTRPPLGAKDPNLGRTGSWGERAEGRHDRQAMWIHAGTGRDGFAILKWRACHGFFGTLVYAA